MVKVIDAKGLIAGRLAGKIAKIAIDGDEVIVVNAEQAVISGNPKSVLKWYLEKLHRGHPYHGPFTPRRADMILRRMIKGMIPFNKPNGKKAFSRVKVFIGTPKEYEGKAGSIKQVSLGSRNILKYTTIGELSKAVGGMK